MALLESWNLRGRIFGEGSPLRYMAAGDAARARQLEAAFRDDEVTGVLVLRGGFGAARLHGLLDLSLLRAHRKLFVGFSDVSVLLNRIVQEAALVCYHGPMIAADLPRLSPRGQELFRRFLFNQEGWWVGVAEAAWRGGSAEGMLVGGCLSVLVTTIGTPYEIETRGRVLFLEDVAEKPYRIDRMLSHLKHAGKFDDIAALVLGPMTDCDDGEGPALLREIVLDVLSDGSFTIVFGLEAGHGSDNVALPFGCRVRVDGECARIYLLEDAFA